MFTIISSRENRLLLILSLRLQESATDGRSASFVRRPLRITLVGGEWESSKGGLSTLNRELAKNLARQPEVEVTILLPKYTELEKQEANESNVRLVTPEAMLVSDPIMKLCFPPKDLDIDVVVGHGHELGVPAQIIAKQRNCKRVHIVHTASEELAMLKEGETVLPEGEGKHRTEMYLCKEADVVVAIGPKLKETVSANLRWCGRDERVIDITPGIFSEFAELEQASQEREQFRILVFGCRNLEDFKLKGYDIAAQAIASLKDESYLLQFVGAPKGNEEEVKNRLLKCDISHTQLTVRGFTESREELKKFLCEADLAIMPSRTEGFGLTALEALSAGLPILVSNNSGFGQAIRKVEFGSASVVWSDDPEEWRKTIRHVRQKERKLRLKEACSLRKSYDKEYKWETQSEKLVDRIRQILKKDLSRHSMLLHDRKY